MLHKEFGKRWKIPKIRDGMRRQGLKLLAHTQFQILLSTPTVHKGACMGAAQLMKESRPGGTRPSVATSALHQPCVLQDTQAFSLEGFFNERSSQTSKADRLFAKIALCSISKGTSVCSEKWKHWWGNAGLEDSVLTRNEQCSSRTLPRALCK